MFVLSISAVSRSFVTMLSHVVFGFPLGRLTGLTDSFRACLAGVSGRGSLSRCRSHDGRRFFTFALQGMVLVSLYTTLFFTLSNSLKF